MTWECKRCRFRNPDFEVKCPTIGCDGQKGTVLDQSKQRAAEVKRLQAERVRIAEESWQCPKCRYVSLSDKCDTVSCGYALPQDVIEARQERRRFMRQNVDPLYR